MLHHLSAFGSFASNFIENKVFKPVAAKGQAWMAVGQSERDNQPLSLIVAHSICYDACGCIGFFELDFLHMERYKSEIHW